MFAGNKGVHTHIYMRVCIALLLNARIAESFVEAHVSNRMLASNAASSDGAKHSAPKKWGGFYLDTTVGHIFLGDRTGTLAMTKPCSHLSDR